MAKRKIEIICKCGHLHKDHDKKDNCWYCAMHGDWCDYIPDNLAHIELLAKEKKLI